MAEDKTWKDHYREAGECGCTDVCMYAEYAEKIVKCRNCGIELRDSNAKNVGYCLPCYAEMMSDDEEIYD